MARVILFDVNETLLDLRALDPPFERAFGRASVRHEWFGQLLQSAFVSTITDRYADFGTILDPLVPAPDVVGADLDEVADKILTAELGLLPSGLTAKRDSHGGTYMFPDLGLLVLRVAIGGVVMAHGLQKFGQIGGPGLPGITGFFGSVGFRPARWWALLVAVVETVGAGMLIVGLLTPLVGFLIAADLLVAIVVVHWPRFWAQDGGLEFPLLIAAGAIALALVGPGAWSIDAALGIRLSDTLVLGLAIIIALVALGAILTRTRPAAG